MWLGAALLFESTILTISSTSLIAVSDKKIDSVVGFFR